MKTFLIYYLASTGACIALDTIAIRAVVNKVNRGLLARGYEPITGKKMVTGAKESVSEKAVRWIKAIPAFTIPIIRFVLPFLYIKYGERLAEKSVFELIDKKMVTKKEKNMTYEERIAAIEAKKAELESLKESLSNNGAYNFDETDYPTDGYVGEKESKTL